MRHRETNLQLPFVTQSFSRNSSGGSITTTTWSEPAGVIKTIDDCIIPDYQRLVTSGGVKPYLPVRIETRDVSVRPMIGQLVSHGPPSYTASWGEHVGSAVSPYIVALEVDEHDPAIASTVINSAIQKAKMGSWDALTSLAEARKSVLGVYSRVDKIFDFANSYARRAIKENFYPPRSGKTRIRRKQSPRDRIKQFQELWLEGRYQWRPLVGEIGDIMDHLSKGNRSIQEGRSSATEDLSKSATAPDVVSGPRIWQRESFIEGTRTYRGFALAVGQISSANLSPPQAYWELVPFSFLVDKFIAVGAAINAWAPLPGVDIRASGYSIHDQYTVTQEVVVLDNPAVTTSTYTSSQSYRRVTTVNRYKRFPSGAMVPRLYPRLKPADFLDILTLATSRFRKISDLLHRG